MKSLLFEGLSLPNKPTAPAVDSSINILQLLVNSHLPLTQAEISQQTGVPAASCYRILNSLLQVQLVVSDATRKKSYSIGPKIFQMASTIYNRQSIIPYFHPIAEILKNEVHKTVLLSIPVGDSVVVVAKTESPLTGGFHLYVGQTLPMQQAAAGKAILSRREAGTELSAQLERARRLGYAVTHGEIDSTVSCIAAPILNLMNEPIAAISLCVASSPLHEGAIRSYSGPLIQAARQLAARIV
ncbi:IclR family transcriptional regulator [Neisseriaceae bacterium TC5R-5]|nr:IclR family transcriptional regulator [Neisseriaceae bacterium TC5R-5]